MSNKSQSTAIGGFVLGAVVLFVGAVLLFAKTRFNKPTNQYVMFFDSSLAGLDEGAPVVFKGVKVGVVKNIEVVSDVNSLDIYTPVYVDIYPDSFKQLNGDWQDNPKENTRKIIAKGLKATLETQSLVTGKKIVALEFRPEIPIKTKGIIDDYQEFPTAPNALSIFADKLEKLPLSDIAANINLLTNQLNSIVTKTDIPKAIDNFNETLVIYKQVADTFNKEIKPVAVEFKTTMQHYKMLAHNINKEIPGLTKGLTNSIENLDVVLKDTQKVVKSVGDSYGAESELQYQLSQTLTELSKAAHSVRLLADYLERHPEALVYGKDEQ